MKLQYFLFLLFLPLFTFGQDGPVSQIYSSENYYKAIALADYNDDGIVDVWSANSSNNHVEIWVYSHEKDSLLLVDEISGMSSPSNYIHDIAAADLDKDDDIDAVVTLRNAGTYLCINEGGGSWTVSKIDATYGWQIIIEDFDKDENLDIMIATDWSYLKIYYGDGSGSFEAGSAPLSAFTYGDSKGMNAVDVDNDGDLDIIGLSGEWTTPGTNRYFVRAYKNKLSEPDSSWGSFYVQDDSLTMLPNTVQSSNNSAGDLDGDGNIDFVAFTSTNDIIVFYGAQGPPGYYLEKGDTLLKSYPFKFSSVTMFDQNDDSYLDIFACGYDNIDGVIIFENDGSGQFDSSHIQLGHGFGEFHSVKSGDIDGNGSTDIIGSRYNFDTNSNDGFQVYFFNNQQEVNDSITYVNQSASGQNNGTSWDDAYINLQDALYGVESGMQIWVAHGTYNPDNFGSRKSSSSYDSRSYSFEIPDSVSLYGGFNGTETNPDERSFQDNTILSGDIGVIADTSDNSYHIIKTMGNNTVDGFTISGGNSSNAPNDMGAGIYNLNDNINVINCIFENNYAGAGAGISNYRVGQITHHIEITECDFIGNKAGSGAGIGNWDCPTRIERCLFAADSVTNMGGAIYNWGAHSDADIIHCTFYANAAGDSTLGGAVHSRAGGIYTNIINSIFWNNSSDIGYGSQTHGAVTNVYYSGLQQTDNIQGENNIFENPLFVNPSVYDFSLSLGSPCIDSGTDFLVIGSDTLFSSDSTSFKGTAPDMGLLESDYTTALTETENSVPRNFDLMQNYPNPFNPITTIRYMLTQNVHVNLTVYDIQGRKVQTLVNAQQTSGSHSVQFNASNIASGVYLYKITTDHSTKIKKMILVR